MTIKARIESVNTYQKGLITYKATNDDRNYERSWTYQESDTIAFGVEPKFIKGQIITIDGKWVRTDCY